MNQTVILGLDGATWKLLKPLVELGDMPNLGRLLERGVHGALESTVPAMTAPAWATFATGKHPGKHGIVDFMLPTNSLGNMKFATSADIRDITFYEILLQHSQQPILVNLPVTYPPKTDAITITSLLTQGDQWIFPASVKDEYAGFAKYRLTPDESLRLKERKDAYIEDLLVHLDEQIACVQWLFTNKPWDVFFYLFSHSDWVSHLAYTELLEDHDESSRRVFQKIDEYIGWFVDHLPAGANLMLVSDHGFKSYKRIFYFNKWLQQEGYLATNNAGDAFRGAATRRAKETDKIRLGKTQLQLSAGLLNAIGKIPVLERALKWTYHHVVKPYLPVNVKVNVGIDFANTQVCFPKGSYITNAYVNKAWVYTDGIVQQDEYDALVAKVVQKMRAITDDAGNPVIKRVFTRAEAYNGIAPDYAPDIFFELSDYWLVGQFDSSKLFGTEVHNKHDIDGIFLGFGPDFTSGTSVDGLKIQDMMPLLLHLRNLDIPADCDGVVNPAVFAATSPAKTRTPRLRDYNASNEKDKLAAAIGKIKL